MSQYGAGYRFATEDVESAEDFGRFFELMAVLDAKKKQVNDDFHAAQAAVEKAREDANNIGRVIKREINQINMKIQNGESLANYVLPQHIKPEVLRLSPAPRPPTRSGVPDFRYSAAATQVRSDVPDFTRSGASPTLTFAGDGSEHHSSMPFRGPVAPDELEDRDLPTFHAPAAFPRMARRSASSVHSDACTSYRQIRGQYKYSEEHPLIIKNPFTGRGWMEVWCKFCGTNTNSQGNPFNDFTRLMLHLQNGHRAEIQKLKLTGRLQPKNAVDLCCAKRELSDQEARTYREAREDSEFDPDLPRSHKRRRTTVNYKEGTFDADR